MEKDHIKKSVIIIITFIKFNEKDIRFYNEFRNCLLKPIAWDGVFRLRCSFGWKMSNIYGNYQYRVSDLLNSINIDELKKKKN